MEQTIVLLVLILTFILFIWGKIRYDLVAMLSLLTIAVLGIINVDEAFAGFGHSAVITVAAVLVLSRGLMNSGLIDFFGGGLAKIGGSAWLQILVLTVMVAFFSAFMNNIGALAIMMPLAIHLARKSGQAASKVLMPLAFGSLLGGMMTVIGTPPNIIIASLRQELTGDAFSMFDFAPVGITITIIGIIFLTIIGWRLLPLRQGEASRETFKIEEYLTEVKVGPQSPLIQKPLRSLQRFVEGELLIVAILREGVKIPAPSSHELIREGDILIVEASSQDLETFLLKGKVTLVPQSKVDQKELSSRDVALMEAIIHKGSPMEGKTVKDLNLRWKYGVNLLGVSRKGERLINRLGEVQFQAGDVLLLQGQKKAVQDVINEYTCLPLPERDIRLGGPKKMLLTVSIFVLSIFCATTGLLHVSLAFTLAAVLMILSGVLSLRQAYQAIDWPIIVLLGAMIPLGTALEKTGGAQFIADLLVSLLVGARPELYVIVLFLISMLLSNVINNAATAVLMAPIGVQVAVSQGVSVDPFLMAVAIGSSTAFLTPIAHQSNLLVMAPGGYRFSDYFRLGLPLTLLVSGVGIFMILLIWPL